jgi:hypothetical protein
MGLYTQEICTFFNNLHSGGTKFESWPTTRYFEIFLGIKMYRASHSWVAPENVGLQKEQKCNTFACHACNEVRLCVLGIRKKEVGNKIR